MDATTIFMREDGHFDLPAEGFTWRVLHEERYDAARPWVLVAFDAGCGLTASRIAGNLGTVMIEAARRGEAGLAVFDCYETLDDALVGLARQAIGGAPGSRFRIVLPCGSSFLRPGKIPAEQVMSRFGWIHVRRLRGYMMMAFPEGACAYRVHDGFRKRLPHPGIRLGEAVRVEVKDGTANWCADVLMECGRFIRADEVQTAAAGAFEPARTDMLPYFDFVPHSPTVHSEARVIPFPRARQAA